MYNKKQKGQSSHTINKGSYASVSRIFPHGLDPILEEVIVGTVLDLVRLLDPVKVSGKLFYLLIIHRMKCKLALASENIRHW